MVIGQRRFIMWRSDHTLIRSIAFVFHEKLHFKPSHILVIVENFKKRLSDYTRRKFSSILGTLIVSAKIFPFLCCVILSIDGLTNLLKVKKEYTDPQKPVFYSLE